MVLLITVLTPLPVDHSFCFVDAISKFEEEKERLFMRYEQISKHQTLFSCYVLETLFLVMYWKHKFLYSIYVITSGKRERSIISEQEKACADKINQLEESLKKKKQVHQLYQVP